MEWIKDLIENNSSDIIKFFVFLIGGYLGIKLILLIFKKTKMMKKIDPTIGSLLSGLLKFLLFTGYIIALLSSLGVPMTTFIAMFSAVGLAIALALQGNLSNFASTLMILFFKPFKVGDFIESQNNMGTVKEIQMLFTHLLTPDNRKVIIPNSELINVRIINYTSEENRRIDLVFSTSYQDDIDKVKDLINQLVKDHELIMDDPIPVIRLVNHGSSSLDYDVKVWVKKENYWAVRYDLNELIRKIFVEYDVTIPYPQREVTMTQMERREI